MIFDELRRAHGDPESTYLAMPPTPPQVGHGDLPPDRPLSLTPVEDWGVGGDLDPTVPDPTPAEITDPAHPDYVEPWRPPGGER